MSLTIHHLDILADDCAASVPHISSRAVPWTNIETNRAMFSIVSIAWSSWQTIHFDGARGPWRSPKRGNPLFMVVIVG
jgi:hypothetical protein